MTQHGNLKVKDKQFGLTTFALKNKTTVFVLTVLVIFMGISTYLGLPKENFPEIEGHFRFFSASYPDRFLPNTQPTPIDSKHFLYRWIAFGLRKVLTNPQRIL